MAVDCSQDCLCATHVYCSNKHHPPSSKRSNQHIPKCTNGGPFVEIIGWLITQLFGWLVAPTGCTDWLVAQLVVFDSTYVCRFVFVLAPSRKPECVIVKNRHCKASKASVQNQSCYANQNFLVWPAPRTLSAPRMALVE